MKYVLSLLTITLALTKAYSQGEIPVNMYTGTPSIDVPLAQVSHHDINFGISMSYSANGIRASQGSGWYGLGWNLSGANFSVRRKLKGLPDDFTGTGTDQRRGWLYANSSSTTIAAEVASLSNTSDILVTTCSDETADYLKLASWGDLIDSEPDVFSFSFPGQSGSFVFDNSATPTIHFIPYKDFSVSYTTVSGTDKTITGFTIKTNDGYTYTFGRTVAAKRSIIKNTLINQVTFLEHDFNQYDKSRFPEVIYNEEWKLTRIDSPTGAYVDFSYSSVSDNQTYEQPVHVGIYFNSLAGCSSTTAYTIEGSADRYWLDYISGSSGQRIDFIKNERSLTNLVIKDYKKPAGTEYVKEFAFLQDEGQLTQILEYSGSDKMPPYQFSYVDKPLIDYGNHYGPEQEKESRDLWGYANLKVNQGSLMPKMYIYPSEALNERFRFYRIPNYSGTEILLDGIDRTPDEFGMKAGMLNKIRYPSGGGAVIEYELNQYYDSKAGQNQVAGGLRVKTITEFDGMNSAGKITKQFFYTDPTSGQSSGKLISRPVFIMPALKYRDPAALNDASKEKTYSSLVGTQTTANLWRYLTIRTDFDLSDGADTQGSPVGYQFVTVKRTGAGSARYEFLVPAVYGEASNGAWTATQNSFARPGCNSMGIVSSGGAYGFPYATSADVDMERGLISKKSEFSETGALVRFTQNDYQYLYKTGSQPYNVSGVYYDKYPNGDGTTFFFGKYSLLTDYVKVLSKETVTTYDATTTAKSISESSEYFYSSPNHKLLSLLKKTAGNGNEYTTRFKYAADFTSIPSNSEPALLRIKDLQDPARFRAATLIEQYTTSKPSGGTEKVTGATLVKLSDFSVSGKILPQYNLALSITDPITDFTEVTTEQVQGVYKLKPDNRYEVVSTINAYDNFDIALSQTGLGRKTATTTLGYNKTAPVAVVNNAGKGEYAFSDFEIPTLDEFQIGSPIFYATPHSGAQGLYPSSTLTKTVAKSPATDNYTISFWFKNTAAVTFQLTVKSTDLATTYSTQTFTVTPSGSGFDFVRKSISVTSAPSTFAVQLQGQSLATPSGSSPTLLPAIDDVGFYPEHADMVSYTYALPFGAASVTNSQGQAAYTTYDMLGRQIYTYDKDKNILSRRKYSYGTLPSPPSPPSEPSAPLFLLAHIECPSQGYINESLTFKAVGAEGLTNVTYEWDFGSGYTAGISQVNHTFTAGGEYQVKLRVTHPTLGQKEAYQVLDVICKPITVTVCANGALQYKCNSEIYVATGCPAQPSPSQGTVFYASFAEQLSGVTYTWKKRYLESDGYSAGPWMVVGTNSNQYSISNVSPHQRTFEIKCEVTSSDRCGESTQRVDVFPCD